jgi:hypothetical protein
MALQFNAPPAHLFADVIAEIKDAVATLPDGKHGAIVGVVTLTGSNAAVVAKIGQEWVVTAFVAKSWSKPLEGGATISKSW